MKLEFITTKNVKKFAALMAELKNLPPNIPKMALVYGEPGLGKSETITKWAFDDGGGLTVSLFDYRDMVDSGCSCLPQRILPRIPYFLLPAIIK